MFPFDIAAYSSRISCKNLLVFPRSPGSSSEKKVGINKGNGDKNAAKIIDPIKPTEQVVTSEAEGSIGANDLNDISSNIA